MWKINQYGLARVRHHQIKLVKIAVDDARIAQTDDKIHKVIIDLWSIQQLVNLGPSKRFKH